MPTIYIALLDEGTSVWRPVAAADLGRGVFLIPSDARLPDDERWAFQPGERVRCERRSLSEGEPVLVAVESVAGVA